MRGPVGRIGWRGFFVALKDEFLRDGLIDVAGSVTFFGVLALFPFLLFLVSLAALVIDPATANLLVAELGRVAPAAVTEIVGSRIHALGEGGSPELLTLSAVGAVWAASSGVAALMRALNRVYGVVDSRPWWRVRAVAVATTLVAAVGSILASAIAVVTPSVAAMLPGPIESLVNWLRLPIAGLLMMFVWALVYYFLPDVEQRFRFITPGSVAGVIVWLVASAGFSTYVRGFGDYEVSYGALAGVIVLLVWMWISSLMVLIGAEINAVFEHLSPSGKKAGARTMEEVGPDRPKGERPDETRARPLPVPAAVQADAGRPRARRPAPWKAFVVIAGFGYLLGRGRRATPQRHSTR